MNPLKDFTKAYITTLLWSSTDDDGEYLDTRYSMEDLDSSAIAEIVDECREFFEDNNFYWTSCESPSDEYNIHELAGHDFALTRNGHGNGFWCRSEVYGKEHADYLTDESHSFGECNLYVGDDAKLYIM